jgi:hypothetical protein
MTKNTFRREIVIQSLFLKLKISKIKQQLIIGDLLKKRFKKLKIRLSK